MNKIKERIKQLKDSIEQAEQRELDAKNGTREVEAKLDEREGEKTTLLSRINVVNAELDKITKRIDKSNDKLDNALARSEKSEVRRKQLTETEVDDYERSEEVESTLKTVSLSRATAEHNLAEAERKVLVLEKDLARAHEKYDKFAKRIEEVTSELTDTSAFIRDLEEKDRNASDRENTNEDKAKFLKTQMFQTLGNTESQVRQIGKQERYRKQLECEIAMWKEKEEVVQKEISALANI